MPPRQISLTELHELLSEMFPRLYLSKCADPEGEKIRQFVERAVGTAAFLAVKRMDDQDRNSTS